MDELVNTVSLCWSSLVYEADWHTVMTEVMNELHTLTFLSPVSYRRLYFRMSVCADTADPNHLSSDVPACVFTYCSWEPL